MTTHVKTLSTGDVSKLLGTTSQTIINWTKNGTLECQRIGKGPRRILVSSVLGLIESQCLDPASLNQEILSRISRELVVDATHSAIGIEVALGVIEAEVSARGISPSDDLGNEKIKGADVITSIELLKRTLIKEL